MLRRATPFLVVLLVLPGLALGQDTPFSRMDVFELAWAENPRLSPDGEHVVYERKGMDVMEDRRTSALWIMDVDGSDHAKLTNRSAGESSPRWSPDGSRIAFTSSDDPHGSEIYVHGVESGTTIRVTQMENAPGGLSWSPDGSHIAFSAHVTEDEPQLVSPPDKPEGADWAEAPRVETRLNHESDGVGRLEYGYDHLAGRAPVGRHHEQVVVPVLQSAHAVGLMVEARLYAGRLGPVGALGLVGGRHELGLVFRHVRREGDVRP
ncbi:MAG: DPP IV N-terminal domain-containing protein, partial [Salinibacter sp.]